MRIVPSKRERRRAIYDVNTKIPRKIDCDGAVMVLDASNLSGIVYGFKNVMDKICSGIRAHTSPTPISALHARPVPLNRWDARSRVA